LILVREPVSSGDLSAYKNKPVLLLVSYSEAATDAVTADAITGDTRWTETAILSVIEAGQTQDPNTVTLARLLVGIDGTVTVDLGARVYAGLRLPAGPPGGLLLQATGSGQAQLTSDLLVEGNVRWGNHSRLNTDQGGSLELGGDSATANPATTSLPPVGT
jgi:hypothetical protein